MKKLILLSFSLMLLFSACKKDAVDDPSNPPENMEDLIVSDDFSWKTTRVIQLTLTAKKNALAQVTNQDGIAYQKVFLKSNTPNTVVFSMPAYETSVVLKAAGQVTSLDLGNGTLSYQFQ